MPLYELHPFTPEEISNAPEEGGIYVLFQVETPVQVGHAVNLRRRLVEERANRPSATHFAVETGHQGQREMAQRAENLRLQLAQVRTKGFVGGPR